MKATEFEMTLDEVAKRLNLSKKQVRQIEAKALRKLKSSPKLRGYCDNVR